ncbi:uncharacterized protein LOC144452262 [Glandiceps talaboti]
MHSCVLYHAKKEIKSPESIQDPPASTPPTGFPLQLLTKENCESLTMTPEETDTHWGVLTQIDSKCRVCRLPLTLSTLQIDGTVLVGKCGHTFHSRCLPEKLCTVCCKG